MSSVIHMDTEQVSAVARQLGQASSDIQQEIISVGNRLRSLNWQSPNRDKFIGDAAELQRKVQAHAEMGAELGFRMQREVDEWIAVDSGHPFGSQNDGKTTDEKSNLTEWLQNAGDVVDFAKFAGAGLYIASMTKDYGSGIKFFGPQWVKNFAGISETFNNGSATTFANNLIKNGDVDELGRGLAALDWGGKAIDDWNKYDKGSEKAAALTVDAAFVIGETVGEKAFQSWVMGTLGVAVLGTMATLGAPALLVVGVGFGLWWGSGYVFNEAADAIYNAGVKDALVQAGSKFIDGAVDLAGQAANGVVNAVDSAFKGISNGISNLFGS